MGGRTGRRVGRDTWLRAAAVAVITASVTLAAACSDEDTVDTIPPPWPARTTTPDGPPGPPRTSATTTSTITPVSPTTTRPPVLSTAR
ncbi:hypothetical protein [Intrasporangium sp. YIM S08009]|uniref:hypothetical protein n=1 Tax=Intrasporangium zincisolvens TaxID=3080018 RepID=UPI002B0621C5|nr:hypothetical protein [Intrasporangium sp. YIM S08009]